MTRYMRNPSTGRLMMIESNTFKEDLKNRAQEKLKELGDFPSYITADLRDKIIDLQKEFLQLRQTKKFTEEKGIKMNQEIDELNKELIKIATEPKEEEEEDRKRRPAHPKSKRKVCRCKK